MERLPRARTAPPKKGAHVRVYGVKAPFDLGRVLSEYTPSTKRRFSLSPHHVGTFLGSVARSRWLGVATLPRPKGTFPCLASRLHLFGFGGTFALAGRGVCRFVRVKNISSITSLNFKLFFHSQGLCAQPFPLAGCDRGQKSVVCPILPGF